MAAWAAETCRHTSINFTVIFYWNLLCLDVNIYLHFHFSTYLVWWATSVTENTRRGITCCFVYNYLKRVWKNRSGHLPNKNQKSYRLNRLVQRNFYMALHRIYFTGFVKVRFCNYRIGFCYRNWFCTPSFSIFL